MCKKDKKQTNSRQSNEFLLQSADEYYKMNMQMGMS